MGYRIDLWKNGKPHTLLVARLVATTFLEDLIDTNMTVNHKNGNRLDNRVENLEWLTLKENIKHGFENNIYTSQQNVEILNKNTGAKAKFRSLSEASRFLNKNNGYISRLKNKNQYSFNLNNSEYEIIVQKKII